MALGGPSGAAFTTNENGTAVNQNHYSAPEDVFLNGGPPCHAPAHAAALPNGDYYFQVTTPNGKTLLSTADISLREFHVANGIITSTTGDGVSALCPDGRLVVRLAPFSASPNGVYKLWISPDQSFKASKSKTDNFMVDASDSSGGDQSGGGSPGTLSGTNPSDGGGTTGDTSGGTTGDTSGGTSGGTTSGGTTSGGTTSGGTSGGTTSGGTSGGTVSPPQFGF